ALRGLTFALPPEPLERLKHARFVSALLPLPRGQHEVMHRAQSRFLRAVARHPKCTLKLPDAQHAVLRLVKSIVPVRDSQSMETTPASTMQFVESSIRACRLEPSQYITISTPVNVPNPSFTGSGPRK